ncbi:MAG: DUF3570 domain-containing protein [Chlorobi bacterium]|nr:DUF3570 domain-containing protein [Chlorobiota bacterium]
MKRLIYLLVGLGWSTAITALFAQDGGVFKKRALDNTEVNWILSVYGQDGPHAAVTGGIGTEQLTDVAQNIQLNIPVKEDGVLNVDLTISGYTSASSSNLNPFSGASRGEEEDDDDDEEDDDDDRPARRDDDENRVPVTGSPWVASSGASRKDVWVNVNAGYSHYSADRNKIYSAGISIANEFDYFSKGMNASFTSQFNQKNSEITVGAQIFLDKWRPEYPTEIKTWFETGGNLNADFFQGVPILDQQGNPTDKINGPTWKPVSTGLIDDKRRNTYVLSLSFSQVLSPRAQMSLMTDITYQTGWLANPMQRVYFADRPNYYIGRPEDIPRYTDPSNTGVFQLADDYEKLPRTRFKVPLGMRLHYYVNETAVVRTYYRYYFDDWGIRSHTLNLEIPLKISDRFTLYPAYRFYTQTAARYFAPYETHLSTQTYYTSDYDLSAFDAHQFGAGIKYTDIFTKWKLWKLGIKSMHLDYNHYRRSNGLRAHIVSWYMNLVWD